MLSKLNIKNYILMEELNVDFTKGLNVISGETGAGKSIFISAINFALGGKTDKNVIMTNSEFCRVEVEFDRINESCYEMLQTLGIEIAESLIISRKLTIDGKNEIRVNGQIVNLTMLKQIAVNLVEIYGQHAYQVLLDETRHIDFVDATIKETLNVDFEKLNVLLKEKNEINRALGELILDDSTREREKQMLCFEIEDIKNADLQDSEDEMLKDKLMKMKNMHKIVEGLEASLNLLKANEDCGALENVYSAQHKLNLLCDFDSKIKTLDERLNCVRIELDDIVDEIENTLNDYDFNENELELAENRLDKINLLKKKYGSSIEEIKEYLNNATQKLNDLENSEQKVLELKAKLVLLDKEIYDVCENITKKRKNASKVLEGKLISELNTLGILNAQFVIDIHETSVSTSGKDSICFLFSANKGQKIMPLAKVISGGEMSRFMLAFDIIFGLNKFETLVFDEVDTGISGGISHLVAQKLFELSKSNQIIAITHLPALCAMADSNFKVSKKTVDDKTTSTIKKLDEEGKLAEIARLAGSAVLSGIALSNAEELKHMCDVKKVSICAN